MNLNRQQLLLPSTAKTCSHEHNNELLVKYALLSVQIRNY